MSATTIRTPKRTGYTVVPNGALPEGKISARAWGLYVYLLSRPPGWEVRTSHLQKVFSEGRDAIYSALKQLVTAGLMVKESYTTDEGLKRSRYAMIAPEDVHNSPDTDFQDAGNPDPENTGQVITDLTTTELNQCSTSKQSSEGDVAPPIKDQGRRDTTKAENADPISPAFYHSKDREVLITNVQMIAQRKTKHDPHGPEVDDAVYHFEQNLMAAFNEDDDVIGWMITDRDWTPPRNATNRLKAAVWLNKLLNEWRNEAGPLTWRGDAHGLAA